MKALVLLFLVCLGAHAFTLALNIANRSLPPVWPPVIWTDGKTAGNDWATVESRIHDTAWVTVNRKMHPDEILPLFKDDGSFRDLVYDKGGSTPFRTHGTRLGALTRHHLLGTSDYAQQITDSFAFLAYRAPDNTDSNWWGHLIGTPTNLWPAVFLARDVIPSDLLAAFLDRYWVNTKFGAVWSGEPKTGRTSGGNLMPRALMAEVEGVLRGTYATVHEEVKEVMNREFVDLGAWDMNGLRADGCLHQHNVKGDVDLETGYLNHTLGLIYNGSYGMVLLQYASRMFSWFTGTTLDFSDGAIEGLFDAYLKCNQWLFRGKTVEPSVCGRFITKGSRITEEAADGAVWSTGRNLLELKRHEDAVNAAINRYKSLTPDEKDALVGHKHFFNSDLSAHHRYNYMATVRVSSNRTVRPEVWLPSHNNNGYFQGDGFTSVLVDSKEFGEPGREVFQVYDWARVPGVTNQYTTNIPQYQSYQRLAERFFNNATFVGGVTDGLLGLTFMDYNRPHVPLTALKSWFFFDDAIVVLGSDITLPAADDTRQSVITTLTQVIYANEHTVGLPEGGEESNGLGDYSWKTPSWLHHRGVGYVFLTGNEDLRVTAKTHILNKKTIDLFTAWLDHGSKPTAAQLAYAVLPDSTKEKTHSFSLSPGITVLSQNSDVHAVCHKLSRSVGAAFKNGRTLSVPSCGDAGAMELRVDIPCLVLATVQDSQVKVSVADPQQIYDKVQVWLTVGGQQRTQTVTLPPPPNRGSSHTVFFTLA